MKLGYARVSTVGQELETQITELKKQGIEEENIYVEKKSGKSTKDRPSLNTLLNFARSGDTIYITKIDRLARSILDLNHLIQYITKKSIDVVFIDNNMSFSANKEDDPFQMLLFNTLGSFAQFERDMILSRTSEGRARAINNGKKMGRKGQPQSNIKRALKLYDNRQHNNLSVQDIVKMTGVPKSTLYLENKKRLSNIQNKSHSIDN